MSRPYSQFRAMMAIARASLRAIFRSPSAVIFSLGFPLIFILVFGFIGGGGTSVSIALKNPSDSNNYVVRALQVSGVVKIKNEKDSMEMRGELVKGRIAAIISVDSSQSPAGF